MINIYTNNLLLKTVTEEDIDEVARMWEWDKAPVSIEEARNAILCMQENHGKNKHGFIHHLCLAITDMISNKIIGWCGLDGQCCPGQIVIFYSIETSEQRKGYAASAASKLLEYAFETLGIDIIHGGCDKNNIASVRVMEKVGMHRNPDDENGDPSFYIDKDIYFQIKKKRQKLIIITGSPCVGKTTVAEYLFEFYGNCAYFDGDWAWRVNPFSIFDPRLRNGDKTMSFALSTYLNSAFDYVIFSSIVVLRDPIRENIITDITAKDYEIIGFTLKCSEETLTKRHRSRGDTTEVIFDWLHTEPHPGDFVINTDNKTVKEIVDEMIEIIG